MHDVLDLSVRSFGASDCAVSSPDDGLSGLPYAISVVVRLSESIVDEIGDEPTFTYFNHYRSVNYLIDQILLRTGLWLQEHGGRYITVAASQSKPDSPFEGRYSHKKAACLAGLGSIGKNGLFLHHCWGAEVRLGTIFTDWPGCGEMVVRDAPFAPRATNENCSASLCTSCDLCIRACPSGALSGEGFDPVKCSSWMKQKYQHIGRGAVCGICIRVCPASGCHYGT